MIENGKTVKFHYTLSVKGDVVDSSKDKDPLQYVHGEKKIIPGLERELTGLEVGAQKKVVVGPEDAYGPVDPNAFADIPRKMLAPDVEPKNGMMLQVPAKDGKMLTGTIVEVQDETLKLNFNHPLAGEELTFDIEVVGVE